MTTTTTQPQGAWSATGPQAGTRVTTGGQGAVTTQSPIDEQTKQLVRTTADQIKAANTELAKLTPQLAALNTQLAAEKKAVPFRETINPATRGPHEQKVDQTTAKIATLTGQVEALRTRIGQLDGQINTALTTALAKDPDFKTRGAQIATLQRADTATKQFLGTIDSTMKSLKAAQGAMTSDNLVNGLNAIAGGSNSELDQALAKQRELQKATTLATANAKYSTLPTYAEAWKTQIDAFANETVNVSNTGNLGASTNTWLPVTREIVGADFANSMQAMNEFTNAIAIGRAIGKTEALHEQVAGYGEQLGSKIRTLQTTQNNTVVAARTQALQ